MNLILLKDGDFISPNRARISGRRLQHIRKVIRPNVGDTLTCGKINGKMGTAVLESISRQELELTVTLEREPPPPLPLTLVLALPRPKMLKRIVAAVTSLGVKKIYLINSWRVEKSFWDSQFMDEDKLAHYMELGLEQARDTIMPELHIRRYFTAFVKDELPGISRNQLKILAHPKTDQVCPAGLADPSVLVIGPEGGFIDLEVDTLAQVGFNPYTIGPRILKVETAVTHLISRLYS